MPNIVTRPDIVMMALMIWLSCLMLADDKYGAKQSKSVRISGMGFSFSSCLEAYYFTENAHFS
jgi:hypothetical protein